MDTMPILELTRELSLDPESVESVYWSHPTMSANGPRGDSVLVIRTKSGDEHKIRHDPPHVLDGIDAYSVERKLKNYRVASTHLRGEVGHPSHVEEKMDRLVPKFQPTPRPAAGEGPK